MTPSARIRGILGGGSDGWEILGLARERERAGRHVINLTIGEHDEPTPPAILDAMDASARSGNTGYAPMTGAPELRAAIAARAAKSTGAPASPDQVVVTAGGQAFHTR